MQVGDDDLLPVDDRRGDDAALRAADGRAAALE